MCLNGGPDDDERERLRSMPVTPKVVCRMTAIGSAYYYAELPRLRRFADGQVMPKAARPKLGRKLTGSFAKPNAISGLSFIIPRAAEFRMTGYGAGVRSISRHARYASPQRVAKVSDTSNQPAPGPPAP